MHILIFYKVWQVKKKKNIIQYHHTYVTTSTNKAFGFVMVSNMIHQSIKYTLLQLLYYSKQNI